MKNVSAIVCGISAGTGAGDNTLALIMTRGLAEISRLVHARGGQAMTLSLIHICYRIFICEPLGTGQLI